MSAELSAHDTLSGHVRGATKPHQLKKIEFEKKTEKKKEEPKQPDTKPTNSRGNKVDFLTSGRKPEGDLVDETPINRGRAIGDNGMQRVYSERVTKSPTALPGSRKAISAPSYTPTGPAAITAPGPTAGESASKRAAIAAKGTANKSTIKVAERMVDLEEGPNFGKPVYSITDVPRQWKNNA